MTERCLCGRPIEDAGAGACRACGLAGLAADVVATVQIADDLPSPAEGAASDSGGAEGDEKAKPPRFDSHRDLQSDLEDVRSAAGWLWVAIAFLLSPSLATAFTMLTSRTPPGLSEADALLQVFLLTFPLAIGVAVNSAVLLLLARHDKWPSDRPISELGGLTGQNVLLLGLCFVLLVSASVGNWLGMLENQPPLAQNTGHPAHVIVMATLRLLANYFTLYGPQLFLSSVLVGGFIGWAVVMKILPNLLSGLMSPHPADTLREQLLLNVSDHEVRRRYLAQRTGWHELLDVELLTLFKWVGLAVVLGAGFGSWLGSHSEKFREFGPSVMAVLGAVSGPLLLWVSCREKIARWQAFRLVQKDLGPLPADAPADVEAARRRFLSPASPDEACPQEPHAKRGDTAPAKRVPPAGGAISQVPSGQQIRHADDGDQNAVPVNAPPSAILPSVVGSRADLLPVVGPQTQPASSSPPARPTSLRPSAQMSALRRWSRRASRTFLFSLLTGVVLFGLALIAEVGVQSPVVTTVGVAVMWCAFGLALLSGVGWGVLGVARLILGVARLFGSTGEQPDQSVRADT